MTLNSRVLGRSGPATPTLVAILVVALSVLVRVWALTTTSQRAFNGDQAVTGVMVQRILAGQNHYVFFAGQEYNGSVEQYLQAAMYWVFHLPQNNMTLRFPEIALAALITWLTYVVGCRLLERPWAAALAAGLIAFGPFWTFARGLGSYGSYPSLLVVGLFGLYSALRLGEGGRRSLVWAACLGFSAGVIAWLGLSGVELLIPAVFLAAPYFLRSWRLWAVGVPAMFVGMLPLLVWSLRNHSFALLNAGPPVQPSTAGQRLHNLFGPVLREFIGVAYTNGDPGWPTTLQYLLVAVLAVTYVVVCIRRRRSMLIMLKFRAQGRSDLDALLLAMPVLVVIYAASKWAWISTEPRYLYAFSPVLILCLAASLPHRPRPARVMAVSVGAVIFAATSVSMLANRPYVPSVHGLGDLQATSAYLQAKGELRGYADYWTAMPLLYVAGGVVDVAPLSTGRDKFLTVTASVDAAPDFFYVATNVGLTTPFGAAWLCKILRDHQVSFRQSTFGRVVVLDQLSPALRPWQLGIGTKPRD